MRWPWSRRCLGGLPEHHDQSIREAERHLQRLREQRPRVTELERLATQAHAANHFTEKITRGLGGRDA